MDRGTGQVEEGDGWIFGCLGMRERSNWKAVVTGPSVFCLFVCLFLFLFFILIHLTDAFFDNVYWEITA